MALELAASETLVLILQSNEKIWKRFQFNKVDYLISVYHQLSVWGKSPSHYLEHSLLKAMHCSNPADFLTEIFCEVFRKASKQNRTDEGKKIPNYYEHRSHLRGCWRQAKNLKMLTRLSFAKSLSMGILNLRVKSFLRRVNWEELVENRTSKFICLALITSSAQLFKTTW